MPFPSTLAVTTRSGEETEALGRRAGAAAKRGDVILLAGELGAGKTCFVRGIAAGLECPERVTSPSFVLLNEYSGRETVFHVDLYRLAAGEGLDELGLWDHAEAGVLVVEWPERADGQLPEATLTVELSHGDGEDERRLLFRPSGERGGALLAAVDRG